MRSAPEPQSASLSQAVELFKVTFQQRLPATSSCPLFKLPVGPQKDNAIRLDSPKTDYCRLIGPVMSYEFAGRIHEIGSERVDLARQEAG